MNPKRTAAPSVLVALLSASSPACADEWFGRDKVLHFGASTVLGAGGYAASALVLDEPWQRATAGAGFSLSLGIAKEAFDATGAGDPSWKDLTWDLAGTAVGVGVALLIDVCLLGNESPPETARPTSGQGILLRF